VYAVHALLGQALTSLVGLVSDPTGAIIGAARITVINSQTGIQRQTASNSEGRYVYLQILPGTYELTATAVGLADVSSAAQTSKVTQFRGEYARH
jgi:hypothetical protein